MVRPAAFCFNEQTAVSNAFQSIPDERANLQSAAEAEFDAAIERLASVGVDVWVVDDTTAPIKPDAVFPNNWISTHTDGKVVLYPMHAPNRRLERRSDVVSELCDKYEVTSVLDLSHYESQDRFLEGTGSIVFDHDTRVAYACLSPRTDAGLLAELCQTLDYRPHTFHAVDGSGKEIYHTNVVMGIGSGFAVVCLDSVADAQEMNSLRDSLEQGDKEVIPITLDQMKSFAGNLLSIATGDGRQVVALSQTAYDALSEGQRQSISKYAILLPLSIPVIESVGGGSVRCMIAQNFLPIMTVN
jgi:hypothetical protein